MHALWQSNGRRGGGQERHELKSHWLSGQGHTGVGKARKDDHIRKRRLRRKKKGGATITKDDTRHAVTKAAGVAALR